MTTITLSEMLASPAIVDDLDWPFDFCLRRSIDDVESIRLKPEYPSTVIAGDGTGGIFLAYGAGPVEIRPILHGTSEGQCGRVAENLTEWMALMLALPYWRDLLKFSGGGMLKEMRTTATFMVAEYVREFPELPELRRRIKEVLSVPDLDDPVAILHKNVHATDCILLAEDGSEFDSLFNSFLPGDNPEWR